MADDPKTESMDVGEPKPVADSTDTDTVELLETLKGLNLDTPEDIQNMAHASSQTGRAYNEVGELKTRLAQLEAQQTAPQPQPAQEDVYGGQGEDLDTAIQRSLGKFWTQKSQEQQQLHVLLLGLHFLSHHLR